MAVLLIKYSTGGPKPGGYENIYNTYQFEILKNFIFVFYFRNFHSRPSHKCFKNDDETNIP